MECQFFTRENLAEAYVPIFSAFGLDDGMVARWSANPLGMLWPEIDAFLASGGGNGGPSIAARRPAVIIAAG